MASQVKGRGLDFKRNGKLWRVSTLGMKMYKMFMGYMIIDYMGASYQIITIIQVKDEDILKY